MNRSIKFLCSFLLSFPLLASAGQGFCQDFPRKPVRLIISFSAGGGADILARAFQRPLEKALGTRVIVENIPGGSGKVGSMELIKAQPDGYTIMMSSGGSWVGFYYAKLYDFKIWEKATALGNLTTEAYGFVEARTDSPYKTWADLVKAAKEKPGKLTCGGSMSGGVMEITMMDIAKTAGFEIKWVPFAGAGPSGIALLGGHVDIRYCIPAESIAMIRAGKTRGLAIASDKRLPALPDVPTFKELGIGDSIPLSRALWGPPNLPQNIVDIFSRAMEKASKDPEYIKLVEETLLYTVDFYPGSRVMEETRKFDDRFGPKLATDDK